MKTSHVLSAYLEDISAKAFDLHPDDLYEVIGGVGGIYALYKNERLYYVGLAKNLYVRIKQHRKDKHRRQWNRFSAYTTKKSQHTKELESLTLRIVSPRGNRQKGKLLGARNLKKDLIQSMKETTRLHEAEMLGGLIAQKKRRRAARDSRGSEALSALSGRRRPLRGWRGDQVFRAVLLKSGKIRFEGETYNSPQASASAAVGRRINGWQFWYFSVGNGEWAQLRELK